MKILFICLGNVARSQMAEAFFNHFTSSLDGRSAGCLDFTPAKYGHPMAEVVTVMREEGIDVSRQIVKQVTPQMVGESERIIVLCKRDECPDFVLASKDLEFWKIEDPFGSDLSGFRNIRDQVKSKIVNLIADNLPSVTIIKGDL